MNLCPDPQNGGRHSSAATTISTLFFGAFDRARTRKVSDAPPIDEKWVEPSQIGRILDATTIKNISIKLWKEFNFNN